MIPWQAACITSLVLVKTVFCLALLSAAAGLAQSSGFLLGVDYSEWGPPNATQIGSDSSGALYILSSCESAASAPSCVTKLSPDGKTIVWQNNLGFEADAMAVDPSGGVYVMPWQTSANPSVFVAKLNSDGMGFAWQTPVGLTGRPVLAVDSEGRAYSAGVFGPTTSDGGVIRLNAAGTAEDYVTPVVGTPTSIVIDQSGAAFVAGSGYGGDGIFLARLTPNGSAGFYSSLAGNQPGPVALDPNGNAVVYATDINWNGLLERFDSTGAVTQSTTILWSPSGAVAVDSGGNAYVAGSTTYLYPVRNSLATCTQAAHHELFSVFSADGSLLQTSYVPGDGIGVVQLIAAGLSSTIYLIDSAAAGFVPTQAGPFAGGPSASVLVRLSPNASAQTDPFACMGNPADYLTDPIAPGGMVTLFGNELGPEQGVETVASPQTPFPTQAGDMEVTFDGTPAPLLWVGGTQINAVVPWSLTPGKTTQVCVWNNATKTGCLTWPVAQTDPGVFTVDGAHAAALNQDGSVNSAQNPAQLGSIVSIFAAGLGPISPPQADGALVGLPLPGNVLPAGVYAFTTTVKGELTGTPQPVSYAGPALNLVAGLSQIKFNVVSCCYFYLLVGDRISQPFTLNIASSGQ
jgi:uncharacterized protein (TIGR03437 family)